MSVAPEIVTEVGPRELAAGVIYIADVELDEGPTLHPGMRVTVRDGGGGRHEAVVARRVGARWMLLVGADDERPRNVGDEDPSILLALRVARRLENDGDHGAAEAEAIRTIVRRYQQLR